MIKPRILNIDKYRDRFPSKRWKYQMYVDSSFKESIFNIDGTREGDLKSDITDYLSGLLDAEQLLKNIRREYRKNEDVLEDINESVIDELFEKVMTN